MFRSSSETITLFDNFKHITTEDELRLNENLERHGSKVLDVIDEVITNIDNVDFVLDLLGTTGSMHKNFRSFTPDMFWRIEEPFLKAVMLTLGDRYTDNMDAIYKVLIKFILHVLSDSLTEALQSGSNST